MKKAAADRDTVLAVMRAKLAELEAQPPTTIFTAASEAPAGEAISNERLAQLLREGLQWAETEEPRLAAQGEIDDLKPGVDYISRNTVIALVQSALNETSSVVSTVAPGAVPLRRIAANVAMHDAEKATFVDHDKLDDFVFELPAQCRVALVSDWGTGSRGAKKVAEVIREFEPHHLIHMGDIYPSGRPKEVKDHFLKVWEKHGPSKKTTKYWAMNGNHEMKSGGFTYFDAVLKFCEQKASYFSLENEHWRLIALDSAYEKHDLHAPQLEWLDARLGDSGGGGARNILLTHHQVFSAFDERPGEHNLAATAEPFIASGRIFGWFWGHEHACVVYEDDRFRARAIGHGGQDTLMSYYAFVRHPAPRVRHTWPASRKGPSGAPPASLAAMNGCAFLEFDGPKLEIAYVDETGKQWNHEQW